MICREGHLPAHHRRHLLLLRRGLGNAVNNSEAEDGAAFRFRSRTIANTCRTAACDTSTASDSDSRRTAACESSFIREASLTFTPQPIAKVVDSQNFFFRRTSGKWSRSRSMPAAKSLLADKPGNQKREGSCRVRNDFIVEH